MFVNADMVSITMRVCETQYGRYRNLMCRHYVYVHDVTFDLCEPSISGSQILMAHLVAQFLTTFTQNSRLSLNIAEKVLIIEIPNSHRI